MGKLLKIDGMRRPIILLLLWLLLVNCYSQEKYIPQSTNFAEFAIYEAITDFADNCRLFKQDSIFYITTLDTLKHYTLQRNQGTLEWIWIVFMQIYWSWKFLVQ